MNKFEKKYLQSIYNQISMEGNFSNIKDRIQIEVDTCEAPKNIYSIFLKILMLCEIIICSICLGIYIFYHRKPLPESVVQNNIEVIYLTLSIVFAFIFLITFLIYQMVKSRKGCAKSEI